MATIEEQNKLIEVLKFTPRTYKISMWGYGGEIVMGTVDKKVWNYCMKNSVDLTEIAWSDEDTVQDEMGLDLDQLPFRPGSWYECDSMAHVNGVNRDSGHIQIEDENGNTVFEKSLDDCDGCENSPQWSGQDEVWVGSRKKGEVVFIGRSNEKGTFFDGEIELREPFDIEKLELYYDEVDGEEIVNSVMYDGEEIDNNGGSTDGKSSDMIMIRLTDNKGNFERYAPEEKDWGHPPHGTSPSTWERSKTFKFSKVQPTLPGYYNCTWKHYGTTYGTAYWNGIEFGEWEYGKFKPISGVETWSGYNWDTSSWVNQPPEPVNTICDNTACGWIGMRSDMREDSDYNSHCPECDGTEFSWIDYDPNTKQGGANRAKYCVTQQVAIDLEHALEELKRDFETLMAQDKVKIT